MHARIDILTHGRCQFHCNTDTHEHNTSNRNRDRNKHLIDDGIFLLFVRSYKYHSHDVTIRIFLIYRHKIAVIQCSFDGYCIAKIFFFSLQHLFYDRFTGFRLKHAVTVFIFRRSHDPRFSVEKCDVHAGVFLDPVHQTVGFRYIVTALPHVAICRLYILSGVLVIRRKRRSRCSFQRFLNFIQHRTAHHRKGQCHRHDTQQQYRSDCQ